jgi:hypothetical protein
VPIKLSFLFFPAENAEGVLPIRADGRFDDIEHGRHVAKHMAQSEHADCDLIDIQTDDGATFAPMAPMLGRSATIASRTVDHHRT